MHAQANQRHGPDARPTGERGRAQRPPDGRCKRCGGVTTPHRIVAKIYGGEHWLEPPVICDACAAQEQNAGDELERRWEARGLLAKAGLPQALAAWDFEQAWDAAQAFKGGEDLAGWQKAWQECKTWHGGRTGLLLRGPAGTGKSVLAVCALKAWVLAKAEPAFFLAVPELCGRIRHKARAEAREVVHRALDAGLAVLDDLGVERLPSEAQRELVRIIDRRQADGKPTLVTTNAGDAEIARRFRRGDAHGRFADRLVGYCRPVLVHGVSFRHLKAAAGGW